MRHRESMRRILTRELHAKRYLRGDVNIDWRTSRLEHALPPTGGWGLGIDRLVMFLTDSTSASLLCSGYVMLTDERC